MKRMSILVLLVGVLAACGAVQTAPPPGPTQGSGAAQATDQVPPTTTSGAGGATLAAAAKAIKDWCTVMPMDLAAKLVPGASAPQSQLFIPYKCTVSNQKSVVEITFLSSANTDPVPGAEVIPGIGATAYFERLIPDEGYLTVILASDDQAVLYVEVSGNDGKDHRDDTIALAKAVVAKLH